jgi:tetratricopeptide (TPR) repeat protein
VKRPVIRLFGMGDPATVIDQYRRYVQDGRLEISEVMASELSELLLAKPGRSLIEQGHLVTVLRDLASIDEIRTKWAESRAAAAVLVKARKRYVKLLKQNGLAEDAREVASLRAGDEVQRGRVRMQEGALKSALAHYRKAHRLQPGLIEACWRPLEALERLKSTLKAGGKAGRILAKALSTAGPVTRSDGAFELRPEGVAVQPIEGLLSDIARWLRPELFLPAKAAVELMGAKQEIERQIAAIESGEQAADARLQAAIDTLQPTMDYHEYASGR